MEYKRFGSRMVLRIDRGEEVLTQLHRAAEQEGIRLAAVSGLTKACGSPPKIFEAPPVNT